MTQDNLVSSALEKDYPFLQEAAFIELSNSIEVMQDFSKVGAGNTFVGRVANICFGQQVSRQEQINNEHKTAIEALADLDKYRAQQILRTKQGQKKTLEVLKKLKLSHLELKAKLDESITFIEHEIDSIQHGISVRDKVKTVLNNWKVSNIPMSVYSQLLLLLANLKWTSYESLLNQDEDFKRWIQSEILVACCDKFQCHAAELVPMNLAINELKNQSGEVQDAIKLSLLNLNNEIATQTYRVLLGELNQANISPVMSLERLASQLLEEQVI